MISYLSGTLFESTPPELVIDVNGVGYAVSAPMTTFYALPAVGQPLRLFTRFIVREDAQKLYGFSTREERTLFDLLIKISGVGPKLGLAILSGMSPIEFMQLVQGAEVRALTRLPGVGQKMAERIMVELGNRADWKRWVLDCQTLLRDAAEPQANRARSTAAGGGASDTHDAQCKQTGQRASVDQTVAGPLAEQEDAISALVALGYTAARAEKAVRRVRDQAQTRENLIRLALQQV